MARRENGATALLALLALAAAFASAERLESWQIDPNAPKPTCVKPICHWSCHDPNCNKTCTTACYRPNCHMACEETCAACTVECPPPSCTIRCPQMSCTPDGCPACEPVCDPNAASRCVVKCAAPSPACMPACEPPRCWKKCKTTSCGGPAGLNRPVCKLVCRKPGEWCPKGQSAVAPLAPCTLPPQFPCQLAQPHIHTHAANANGPLPLHGAAAPVTPSAPTAPAPAAASCCPCAHPAHAAAAMRFADSVCVDEECRKASKPSLLEVVATMQTETDKDQCCPCAAEAAANTVPTNREEELRKLAYYGAVAAEQERQREMELQALERTPLFSSYTDLVGQQQQATVNSMRGLDELPTPPFPGYPSPIGRRAPLSAGVPLFLEQEQQQQQHIVPSLLDD